GHEDAGVGHAGPVVALIESRLCGFQQEARRRGREVCVLQLLFGGGIESDGAESLGARPAVRGRNRDRFVKGAKRGCWRDFLQKFREIFFAGTKLGKAGGRGIAEVRLREPLDSLAVKAARVGRVATALGVAPKPIEGATPSAVATLPTRAAIKIGRA